MARIDTLSHYLTDIADSIRTKIGEDLPIVAEEIDDYINNMYGYDLHDFFNNDFINSGSAQSAVGFKTFLAIKYKNMQYCPIPIDLGGLSMSLEGAFASSNLTTAPYFINTSGVTSVKNLFNMCSSAQFPATSDWTFLNAIDASNMFNGCGQLIGKVHINLPSCTNVSNMFSGCTSLTHIDMREMTFDNVTNYTDMFGATFSTGVPDNCLIIVKDNAAKTWITSKFSRLTNVKTVGEI